MIYGYIRVSSDKQTVENQRFEISDFCKHQNLSIDDWIEETISGTKNYSKRELGRLLKKVGKDDIIICSELSRLGRNLFMIMEILNICMTKECRVWTIKDNYRLGDDIQSKVLAFAFGLSAEIERNLISQRTKEVLARKKAEGAKLGHPKGFRCRLNPKCANKHEWIIKELNKGTEKTVVAKKLKVSKTTFYRYLVYTGLHTPINCLQEGWKSMASIIDFCVCPRRPSKEGGFDITIGNPPYISAPIQIASPELNEQRQHIVACKKYKSLNEKWDLYVPFMELGLQLLSLNGVFSMIVPYPLTNQKYGKKFRKMITEEYRLLEIADLGGTKIFENATVSNCIPFIQNSPPKGELRITQIFEDKTFREMLRKFPETLKQDEKNMSGT